MSTKKQDETMPQIRSEAGAAPDTAPVQPGTETVPADQT